MGDNTRRNFVYRDLSRFSTKLAEIRGARSSCNPLSDRAKFRSGGQTFLCVFFCRRGEVPCATGCGDRGKTQVEAEEKKRLRCRIAARWKELDERRGLRPTGSAGTHHKASTEAFFTPDASLPMTAALAATHQTTDGKGIQRRAFERSRSTSSNPS